MEIVLSSKGNRLETTLSSMMMSSSNLPPRFTASTQFNKAKRYGNLQAWEFETDEFATASATGKKRFLLNTTTLKRHQWDNLFSGKFITISILLHVTVAVIALILFFLAQFLGWDLSFFDIKTETPKDVEFVITNNTKPEKPRDPNTKNVSTVASRSGGEKSLQRQGEEHQVAGASGAKPSPASPPESSSSPAPQPTQPNPSQAPAEKPTPKVAPKKKPKAVTPPAPPIAVYSDSAPAPSAPKSKWKPKNTPPTADPVGEDDFEPPAPILTKPSKVASASSSSSANSSSKKAVRLGPDQIGSPSSKPTPAGNRGQGGKSIYSNPANSGGGKGLAGVDALADFDFGPYISGVTQRIKRNFNPPSKDDSLKAVVIFTISRSGGVSGVRLLRSSGLPMFDEAALSAVRASAPFRTFPPDADKSSIQMEFSFDYLGVRG
jgi:TonB family protein